FVTVTVNVHWLLLPLLSHAVFVTVVTPNGNEKPLGGTLTTLSTPQLSVAVTLNVTLLEHPPDAALTVMFDGQVMTGGSLSSTVTVNVQVLLLPDASMAVLITMLVPTGNVAPLGGTVVKLARLQLSEAVTLKFTLRSQLLPVALTVMSAGQLIAGGS